MDRSLLVEKHSADIHLVDTIICWPNYDLVIWPTNIFDRPNILLTQWWLCHLANRHLIDPIFCRPNCDFVIWPTDIFDRPNILSTQWWLCHLANKQLINPIFCLLCHLADKHFVDTVILWPRHLANIHLIYIWLASIWLTQYFVDTVMTMSFVQQAFCRGNILLTQLWLNHLANRHLIDTMVCWHILWSCHLAKRHLESTMFGCDSCGCGWPNSWLFQMSI